MLTCHYKHLPNFVRQCYAHLASMASIIPNRTIIIGMIVKLQMPINLELINEFDCRLIEEFTQCRSFLSGCRFFPSGCRTHMSWEIADDVNLIRMPKRKKTLISNGVGKPLANSLVGLQKTT